MTDPTPPFDTGRDAPAPELHLTGRILIAMPAMEDPRFAGSVVLVCAHGPEGAMGLIVNKVIDDITLGELFSQLEIEVGDATPKLPICYGGPVEMQRGFVLHTPDYSPGGEEGLEIDARFAMTATRDVLEDIARGTGPDRALLALGYAGWGPGQLEAEIAENGWLTSGATPDLIFGTEMEGKWSAALDAMGISPLSLSSVAGHA